MRIVINARFLIKNKLEGIGVWTAEIVRRMARNHPEDEFILCFDRPFDKAFLFGPNVKGIVVSPPARHPILFYTWFEWSIPKIFNACKGDIFLSPDGFCSLSKKIDKTILVIHDVAYLHYPLQLGMGERLYYRHFMPKFIHKASQIITVSQASAKDIGYHFPNAQNKTTVIYNGCKKNIIPLSKERKTEIKKQYTDGREFFLSLGAIHPRKNISGVIRGFEIFKQATHLDHKLLLVGRKAWKTSVINDLYEKSPVKKDIHFLNYLPEAEMMEILGASLGLVYISFLEGFGLPLVEAMYAQVPIITSNRSSMKEIAGDCALRVPPEDIKAIGKAMENLALDKHLRQSLVQKGIRRKDLFDWDIAANKVYDQIRETLT